MMIAKYIRLSSADEDARYGDKPESNSVTHQRSAALHCREDIARLKELSNLRTLDRQTVEKLIQSIRVYDGKRIEIVWNFSDSYMKLLTREEQNHEE